ncbi:glutathione S-transferase family protein [Simiduia sp. 21SJ11W-1]|uniref:glutathione S-transferase family protein n=1 Tax=Simiduia sp. 21SJ11W-1 TaxID=2909669 RepID=UPI00209F719C|nr:glutathione S-transferase family protein [Simiduia sp. 21SJ11W-1]UTA47066.1 glutathione S-transferase family protein [Simiduia sp. 21SJ11W-1]
MTSIKVTYFDVNGGRAEPLRLALHWAGTQFEDHRFSFAEFADVRAHTPFGQVPVVNLDGEVITQSNALLRYFGKQAGLYPKDDYQALLCDEVMDAIEDVTHKVVATFGLQGDALKAARQALVAGPFSTYLTWLNSRLVKQGGDYFAAGSPTIADLKVFVFAQWLMSGQLDHVPSDLLAEVAPRVAEHAKQMMQLPKIASYYQARG